MTKRYLGMLPVAAVFFALSANADVALKDESEILGKWKVTAEAAKLDGEKKKVIVEWDFQGGGILMSKATDTGGRTLEMLIPIKYKVEDGVIKKQVSPGREKFEDCKVVEKKGSDMILKCPFLFFFLTKI
ncbi:hypothetical protein [Methyloglobulus sp.]|uniref:hypothetical protein n=1 Tax=Methyloglobulus sp. TaxID=2518622 RepID=UPI00398A1428